MTKRLRTVAIPGMLLALAALAAVFLLGRSLGSSAPAGADREDPDTSDIDTVLPEPGETPDTSEPWWFARWQNLDASLPRYEQTVAGITIGPDVIRTGSPCGPSAPPTNVGPEEVAGSRVDIVPRYLPEGAELFEINGVLCGGEPSHFFMHWQLPFAPDFDERWKAGESFFDMQHGGSVMVARLVGDPAIESSIASEHWSEVSVAGHTAAVARPVLIEGFGRSAVFIYNEGVLTIVETRDVSLDETVRIAEGLWE